MIGKKNEGVHFHNCINRPKRLNVQYEPYEKFTASSKQS